MRGLCQDSNYDKSRALPKQAFWVNGLVPLAAKGTWGGAEQLAYWI